MELASLSPTERCDFIVYSLHRGSAYIVQSSFDLLPQGTITNDIAQHTVEWGVWKGSNLLHAAIYHWAWFVEGGELFDSTEAAKCLFLIKDLISKGSDIHNVSHIGNRTPLVDIIWYSYYSGFGYQAIKRIVKAWLRLLSDCGIDLEKYGKTENDMWENGTTDWHFRIILSGYGVTIEPTKIRIGETPDDLYIEMEDLYFTTNLVADFWGWVEGPLDEDFKVQEKYSWGVARRYKLER